MPKPLPRYFIEKNLEYSSTSPSGLIWKTTYAVRAKEGTIAGSLGKRGYWYVGLNGSKYLCHRIVSFLTNSEFSDDLEIDHLDLNKSNNVSDNLRVCTRSENLKNKPTSPDSLSGYKHINFDKKRGVYYVRWIEEEGITLSERFNLSSVEKSLEAALAFRESLIREGKIIMKTIFDRMDT